MPSLLVRFLLCLSSYFPLTVIFAIQLLSKGEHWGAVLSLVLGFCGLVGIHVYLKFSLRLNPIKITIESVCRKDGEAMSYIVSYLLPFVALPWGDVASCLSMGVFLFVLVILYMNSDMMHINPMLNLMGWHVYEITLSDGEARSLISKRRARKGREASVIQMGDDIFLEVD
jgi:hypothetical protein